MLCKEYLTVKGLHRKGRFPAVVLRRQDGQQLVTPLIRTTQVSDSAVISMAVSYTHLDVYKRQVTLDVGATLSMEITLSHGSGYVSADKNKEMCIRDSCPC